MLALHSNSNMSLRNSRGQFVKTAGDGHDMGKSEDASLQMHSISESEQRSESEIRQIESDIEEEEEEEKESGLGQFMKKSGYDRVAGRIPCPAKTCGATRTLI